MRLVPPLPREAKAGSGGEAPPSSPWEPFKLSLAFSESRFVVPWITTSHHSGSGDGGAAPGLTSLRYLRLTFLFSGSDILQVKWSGDCA